jgi:NAD(P)-dependent dehydrogenase (short-subunit alcohol dehydrogenase family)
LATTEEDWDTLFDVNLKAAYFCAKSAAAIMLKQKSGKIINIADVSAYSPWPDYIPYCTTKAGIIAMTKGLAKRLAPDIQVNAIAAGTVLLDEAASDTYQRIIESETLLKRIGSPQDIVRTVLFLLGETDYITGAIIPVDGGKLIA